MSVEEKKEEQQFAERLEEIKGNMSTRAFSRTCGLTNSVMRKYFKGSMPSIDKAAKIAKAMGVNIKWLITGEGEKLDDSNSPSHVPLTMIKSAVGEFFNDNTKENDVFAKINVPREVYDYMGWDYEKLTAFFVYTDSMAPTHNRGDILFVDSSETVVTEGGLFVFEFEKRDYIKRLQVIGKQVRVLSDNKNFPPFVIEDVARLKVFGRVKATLNKL
jgi:phage repressor protein C with HTH and peptisase S24 domain